MKSALILTMTLCVCFSAPAQQKPDLNVEGFRLGMPVKAVCDRLRTMSARIESLSTDTARWSDGCATFLDGQINGDQKISIGIVDGELASVMSRFPRADYDQMYNETVKRFGKPTRTEIGQFLGLHGKYGKQRRADWQYADTISVTLVDGSAEDGNRVGPGFLLLQSDERAYAGLK
jgi:hypothetical protein